jgi:nitroreductase
VSAIYAEFKRVDNAQVRRERDGRRGRELASLLAAGLPVAMALLAYTGLHLETVRIGYKIERQRAEFARLEDERQKLELALAAATTPEKTAAAARRLELSPPRPGQVLYVGGKVPR